ncbi:uncharacterized protein LOC101450396 [Ceratitis capitata]|uniref:(Mediterranean fruit fly) hypothetical protein n=1 Tax=Ceratitis capitata TaxID=7213 RepID=W8BTH8_CERCA|nr:uncharacterized protein LOC101450396 [Ceratitis capitata]CAD6996099.1 unnamed protein product [Ceratitis capitata]
MGKSKDTILRNSQLQKEQLQLCKIQKELENILGKVNEAINELKVEELQLKAGSAAALCENLGTPSIDNLCGQQQPSTSSKASLSLNQLPKSLACRPTEECDDNGQIDAVIINKQVIDLNMTGGQNYMEEEDEDDVI